MHRASPGRVPIAGKGRNVVGEKSNEHIFFIKAHTRPFFIKAHTCPWKFVFWLDIVWHLILQARYALDLECNIGAKTASLELCNTSANVWMQYRLLSEFRVALDRKLRMKAYSARDQAAKRFPAGADQWRKLDA